MTDPGAGKLLESLPPRFELRGRLGAGGMGIVQRAFDHQLGHEVALKTLRAKDPELFYNLKEEFRAAASIVHPNLVQLYELFVHGSECFFTMELLDAVPFDRWVRHASSGSQRGALESGARSAPANPSPTASTQSGTRPTAGTSSASATGPGPLERVEAARLASGAAQLARAVAALHDAGRLHCDLKPSNILVTTTGRLVVLDFGLSAPLTGNAGSPGLTGTLAYAAPEQIWGGELTAAADWYSVGIVLFQALTGELPDSEQQLQVALAQAWAALKPAIKSRLPARFAALIQELLHFDPCARPSREVILEVLDPPRPDGAAARAHERLFVGRSSELQLLERSLLAARQGWLTVVDVRGESGIGKTELVRQFTLQAQDALVVRGQCRLVESVPYQALDQVIDDLSKHLSSLSEQERSAFLPDDFSCLVRVFPVLGRLARSAALSEDIDGSVLRQRALVALRQMLWRLCAWRPLILWVDDAHWGDAESQGLLCDLLREPAPPLLLLLSHREANAPWLRPISEAVARAHGQWLEIEAGPLDDRSSRDLVERLLGRLARERPPLASWVASESGHVPLFIGQLCRLITESPRLGQETAQSLTLFEVIQRRVAALAPDERRVAELVALIDAPIRIEVVAAAAGLAAGSHLLVSRLTAAQLLRFTGARTDPRLTSYHQHVRETILARLDPASRRQGHRSIALAMEELEPSIVPEVLLHHWLGAGESERACAVALSAARAAMEKSAFAHAAALYRIALDLLDRGGAAHVEAHTQLARALSAAGRAVEAGQEYHSLVARSSAPESLRLMRHCAENFLVGGLLDQGMAVLAQALQQVGLPLPRSSASALFHGLRRVVAFRLGSRARPRAQPVEFDAGEVLRTDLCLSAAKGLGAVDPALGAYFTFSALSVAARSRDPARAATALCLSGMLLACLTGRFERWGEEWLDEAARLADVSGDLLLRGRVLVCRAQVEINRGAWSSVLQHCEAAMKWLELHPDAATWERNMANMAALRALEEMGNLRWAWQRAAEWRAEAEQRGDLYARTTAELYLAFAKLADGDADRAENLATQALARWSAAPPPFQEFYRMRVVAYAELHRGRASSALDVVERAEQALRASRLHRFPMAVLEVSLLRARILLTLARAGQNPARALARCERELSRLHALGRSDTRAYAALGRAGVEAVRGNPAAARRQLGVARERFAERQMSLGLVYAAVAENWLNGTPRDEQELLVHEVNLRRQGIAEPRAWLALHAPGFA